MTDSAGRQVTVPDRIARVIAAGPPASVLLSMLAPQKMVGWNRRPTSEELPYLAPAIRDLPEIGRLTGRGGTENLEIIVAAKADIIVDFGSLSDTYVSLANRVQAQTGVPYLLIDGRFANTVAALRLLGDILGVADRAEQLARRAEAIFAETDRAKASAGKPPRVYLARWPRGLETGNRGSINTEIIERAGAVNVVDDGLERGGLRGTSLEQVLAWNPDTIITLDAAFPATARSSAGWADVDAVRRDRVFVSPRLPYGWIDSPPSVNRLIGLQWLTRIFYPEVAAADIRREAADFYRLFYQVDLSGTELNRLLGGTRKARE